MKISDKKLILFIMVMMFLNCVMLTNGHFLLIPNEKSACFQNILSKEISTKSYTEHSPISIISDSNFTDYGFPGEGTVQSPFIIANYNITTDAFLGVYVFNTTKHFIIRDCYIDAYHYGIAIERAATNSVTLENNECENHIYSGIYLTRTHNVTIQENECTNNDNGIHLTYSNYAEIINNFCMLNEVGIALLYSDYATITTSVCTQNAWGIALLVSEYYFITENILFQNTKGMEVNQSNNGSISDNEIEGSIEGLQIDTCTSVLILKNECLVNTWAITCFDSSLITIKENRCHSNIENGIFLDETTNSSILSNVCYNNNWAGIRSSICEDVYIAGNNCTNNGAEGIRLFYGNFKHVPPATVINNYCQDNNIGIGLYTAYSGLIANNTCKVNNIGLYLTESYYNEITNNIIENNIEYGVEIDELSVKNEIYQNDFICNNANGTSDGNSQAFDDGVLNKWYNEETNIGNYWSSLEEEQTEYYIDGDADARDPFPQKEPLNLTETDEATGYTVFSMLVLLFLSIGIAIVPRRGMDQ